MSKTKKVGSNHYELLFIVANNYTEAESMEIKQNVINYLEKDLSAQITYQENWGKKKLAYEIKHNSHGYYFLIEFDLDGKRLADLNKHLRLSTEVLRHQTVRQKPRSLEEIEAQKTKQEKTIEKKEEKKEIKKEEVTKKEIKVEKKEEKKDNLKDLDQKLEGILSAKDLI
jgi:small subunit ribosomal protein S6